MRTWNRREILAGAGSLGVLTGISAANRSDRMVQENTKPGTTDWQLTYTRTSAQARFRCAEIEGYVSRPSIQVGEKLDFFLSTATPAKTWIDIYRMGYYQGKGAHLYATLGPIKTFPQTTPTVGEMRIRECNWQPSLSWQVPPLPSGVYLGKIRCDAHRYQSYVIFIIKEDRPADLLFQCSDHTWQAYNAWPENHSLYTNDRKDGKVLVSDVKVSWDRPYGKYVQIMDNPLSQGSGEFLLWEYPFAYWLEQQGYDVSYISNSDVHHNAQELQRGKIFLSVGHDEYWSLKQFEHVSAARDAGVHLLFFSGNSVCFVTEVGDSPMGRKSRTLQRVGRFGGIRETEKGYMANLPKSGPNEATLMGAQTITPFNGSGDWICTLPKHWIFENTGMKYGDAIPGLVGWEFHGNPHPMPGLEVVAKGGTINSGEVAAEYTATIYPGPKDNFVFNASTIFWSQGLAAPPGHMPPISHHGRPHGPDPRVQQITKNLIERALKLS